MADAMREAAIVVVAQFRGALPLNRRGPVVGDRLSGVAIRLFWSVWYFLRAGGEVWKPDIEIFSGEAAWLSGDV